MIKVKLTDRYSTYNGGGLSINKGEIKEIALNLDIQKAIKKGILQIVKDEN
jgi:hypothetical protein